MKRICNNCGQEIPDGVRVCPNCGQSYTNDATTPPPLPKEKSNEIETNNLSSSPQPLPPKPAPQEPNTRRKWIIALAIILVCGWMAWNVTSCLRNSTFTFEKSVIHATPDTITIEQNGEPISDSVMQQMSAQAMAQMQQMQEEMDEELKNFFGADPFDESLSGAQEQAQASKGSSTKPYLAGVIGDKEYVIKLDLTDPGNIKGIAHELYDGKKGEALRVIGIYSGDGAMTLSLYKGKQLTGSLNGIYNRGNYQGEYSTPDSEKKLNFHFSGQ